MSIYRMIKKVMDSANITGAQATPKGLRHGLGIAMALHMPLNVLRDIMGHTATKATEIYLHYVGDEKKRASIERLGEPGMTSIVFIKNLFPLLMIFLSIGAVIIYGIGGEYPKTVYWCAAADLTTSTLFV